MPPKTENKIKNGGTFILFPMMYGFSILSPVPTKKIAQIKSPTDAPVCPVTKRKITAGTETTAVPSGGMIEAMPAMTAEWPDQEHEKYKVRRPSRFLESGRLKGIL